jgi:hypothetical protein
MVQLADTVKQLEHWPRGVAFILRGQVYATHIALTAPDHFCRADLLAYDMQC